MAIRFHNARQSYCMLPIICKCRYYTSHIHLLNSNVSFSHLAILSLSVGAAQPLPGMAFVTITSAAIMIIEQKKMLALPQTPSHCDSVVHLHNVPPPAPSAPPPGAVVMTGQEKNSGLAEWRPHMQIGDVFVTIFCSHMKILTLRCVCGGNITHTLHRLNTNRTLITGMSCSFPTSFCSINAVPHNVTTRVCVLRRRFVESCFSGLSQVLIQLHAHFSS